MKQEGKKVKFKTQENRVSEGTLQAIKDMGFKYMTDIQAEVLPIALDGTDVVATAKTGSGKTLAFLIPVIEIVVTDFKNLQGKAHFAVYSMFKSLFYHILLA